MELIIYIGLITCSLSLLAFSIYQKKMKIKEREEQQVKKVQGTMTDVISFKEELKKHQENQFLPQTRLTEIEDSLSELLDSIVENNVDTDMIEQKLVDLQNSLSDILLSNENSEIQKEKLISKTRLEVEKFTTFINNTNFYPPDYLYEARQLEGKITDIFDADPDNYIERINALEKSLYDFHKKFNKFNRLHTDITKWLKTETNENSNDKQDLFFLLQKGELDKASKKFKQMKR